MPRGWDVVRMQDVMGMWDVMGTVEIWDAGKWEM